MGAQTVQIDWKQYLLACNALDGFVYVLTNESLPKFVKVGFTDRRPDIRASELYSTGVPSRFEVAFCFQLPDARDVEQRIHKALAQYRVRATESSLSARQT
jgi:hypothetical protein